MQVTYKFRILVGIMAVLGPLCIAALGFTAWKDLRNNAYDIANPNALELNGPVYEPADSSSAAQGSEKLSIKEQITIIF